MNHPTERATSYRARSRESRALASTLASEPNPFHRILYSAASNRFQVLRRIAKGKYVPHGSYMTLEESIQMRDQLPEHLPPQVERQ
jgi:hypothetical protein